ncbi:MAG TPA: CBS domain-containing protein [Solirubrobacteraceae bacterium]|jgi:CBS domain-containing protein|nr:CBS domain-containing protein [Solirubrobacteraceae bacterium]
MDIRRVMTRSVVTASPDGTVREMAALMRERNVGSVVLIDADDRPVGLITDRDLAITVVADARDPDEAASVLASSPVVSAHVEMDVEEVAALMVRHGIRRLPVLDGERLAGMITLDDLAVRTGDRELAYNMTSQITRASLPDFYFHDRGG